MKSQCLSSFIPLNPSKITIFLGEITHFLLVPWRVCPSFLRPGVPVTSRISPRCLRRTPLEGGIPHKLVFILWNDPYMGIHWVYPHPIYGIWYLLSIVMGDPLYRWIVGWMGWMGWMQCQRNLGMALHKVVHKAREQNLQGRLIKRQWSNYIYIHINRLFFLLLGGFKYDSFWTFSKHIWDDVLPWPTFVWCV